MTILGWPLGKERDYRGEQRKDDTHASTTDPDAELMRKSKNAGVELSYGVHYVEYIMSWNTATGWWWRSRLRR